jgi:hypothetical protein
MSDQRLSRLQKWILGAAIQRGGKINRRDIYSNFWGEEKIRRKGMPYSECSCGNPIDGKYSVTLSRSIASLEQKGMVNFERSDWHSRYRDTIILTDRGKTVANAYCIGKSALTVSPSEAAE